MSKTSPLEMNQNQCPICEVWYDDKESWYEMSNGDYCCQSCMESHQEAAAQRFEDYLESR